MPHRNRWRPSRITAAAGVLLAIALLCGTFYSLWHERSDLVTETAEQQALLARVLEDHASRSLDAAQFALAGLADMAERGAPPEVLQALLAQTQASLGFLRGVALVDERGQVLATANDADRDARIRPAALGPWPDAGRAVVNSFVPARSLAGLSTAVDATPAVPPGVGFFPLLRGLKLPGQGGAAVMVALMNPDALANFQQLTLNDDRAAAALVDLDGRLLAVTASAEHAPGGQLTRLLKADAPLGRVRAGAEHGSWTVRRPAHRRATGQLPRAARPAARRGRGAAHGGAAPPLDDDRHRPGPAGRWRGRSPAGAVGRRGRRVARPRALAGAAGRRPAPSAGT